jgi:quinoprotein glucose dehydrogenase
MLYVPTGGTKVAAIDPATGKTVWLFAPDPVRAGTRQFTGSTRAVSYWTDGTKARILLNSIDGRLFSIDAKTGTLDAEFGTDGVVDLKQDLLEPDDPRAVADLGSTGPGIVVGDVIVIQVITDDFTPNKEATPGYVRGYDVRTGERLWVFHTIPRPGELGNRTWKDESWRYTGNASVWTMMSADPELGLVYLPVESPTHNMWGGQRPGDGLFGESIVCLDARTGARIWHFQITHHGVWDYDLPAAPILHDVDIDGATIKAVTVLTKQNISFVFNRITGEPIWPIEERPVPTADAVPGERLSPTQPFPTRPAPYSRLGFDEEELIDFTPELRAEALEIASRFVRGPMYTPPSLVGEDIPTLGTIVFPGYGGGSNWNGGAVDEETNVLYVPTRNIFMATGLRKADPAETDWHYVVGGGGGGFAGTVQGPQGLPLNKPPWAVINATDMNAGEHVWSRAIGGAPNWVREHPALAGLDLDFENMGQISVRPSPLVTKTLLFLAESGNIAGDPGGRMFRAYDKATGEVIAEIELPAKTSGAPMTYLHEGRQYIAVAVAEARHPAELVVLALPANPKGGN